MPLSQARARARLGSGLTLPNPNPKPHPNPSPNPNLSQGADPLHILCTEAERALWSSQNLPTDRVSVENGAIVCNCARWPLMIDPQLQGVTWIKKREEKLGLTVVRVRARARARVK